LLGLAALVTGDLFYLYPENIFQDALVEIGCRPGGGQAKIDRADLGRLGKGLGLETRRPQVTDADIPVDGADPGKVPPIESVFFIGQDL
jgi:hypothetical protein